MISRFLQEKKPLPFHPRREGEKKAKSETIVDVARVIPESVT